jgi:hypothetical protein
VRRSPKSIYQHFIDFEEQSAAIYLQMASHFCPENRELGSLWLEMGMQEKQHAGLLQFCLAEELFAEELPSDADIHKLETQFRKFNERAADQALTVQQAFEIATELEASEVNGIYSHLTTPLHNSRYLLRRKVMTSLPEHVERLAREAKKFGVTTKHRRAS